MVSRMVFNNGGRWNACSLDIYKPPTLSVRYNVVEQCNWLGNTSEAWADGINRLPSSTIMERITCNMICSGLIQKILIFSIKGNLCFKFELLCCLMSQFVRCLIFVWTKALQFDLHICRKIDMMFVARVLETERSMAQNESTAAVYRSAAIRVESSQDQWLMYRCTGDERWPPVHKSKLHRYCASFADKQTCKDVKKSI